MSSHGIVALSCSAAQMSLALVDPVSGAKIDSENVPQSSGKQVITAKCPNPAESPSPRSAFSPNWDYVTSVDDIGEQDGSLHVGIVSIEAGQLIDLTAETSSSGFSASVNDDTNPTFDEVTGDVWFVRGASADGNGTFYDCPSPYTACTAKGTDMSQDAPFSVVGGTVIYENALPNPAGTVVAIPGLVLTSTIYIEPPASYNPNTDSATDQAVPPTTITSSQDPNLQCVPVAWVTNTSLICSGGQTTPGVFFLVSGATPGATTLAATPLIPTNQRSNVGPIASPGATQFVFNSYLGSGSDSLYTAMIGSTPSNPVALPNSAGLTAIAWQ